MEYGSVQESRSFPRGDLRLQQLRFWQDPVRTSWRLQAVASEVASNGSQNRFKARLAPSNQFRGMPSIVLGVLDTQLLDLARDRIAADSEP
jgi:hypothetical protein